MGNSAKKKKKNTAMKVWISVSSIIVILLLVLTIVSSTVLYNLLNIVMPGGGLRAVYAEGIVPMYEAETTSKEQALENAEAVNLKLCEEGMILLKNENNALPMRTPVSDKNIAKRPKISVFGKNSVNIAYGGSGSGGGDSSTAIDLYTALSEAGYDVNPTLKSFYENPKASGPVREANSSDLDSGGNQKIATAETPQDSYTADVKKSYSQYNDAALVVFTRIGGEGFDLPRYQGDTSGARKADDHYLQLDKNETALLKAVCESDFKHVIVIINSGTTMELSFLEDSGYYAYQSKIDAAIWMGYPGNTGMTALGEILNGSVNPSGRTVDTYSADFKKDPTFVNFGTGPSETSSDKYDGGLYYFVDYEEGIYVGYKYYETRGYTDGEEWYGKNVIYPFGYGLSYTEFSWEVNEVSSTEIKKDEKISVEVTVTNKGDVAGKDVVELYCTAPYYDGGIEKPYVALVGFAKTDMIKPGESDKVTIEFDPYTLASYDYTDANSNGIKGYELEHGAYTLRISKNAHEAVATYDLNLDSDIAYTEDPITGNTVKNRYTDQNQFMNSDEQLSTVLSRSNWDETWPDEPTDEERAGSNALMSALADKSVNNPNDYSDVEMPWTDEEVSLTLRDLLPEEMPETATAAPLVSYEDERWDTILDSCQLSAMVQLYNYGAFNTAAMLNIGKPRTNDTDGPAGFVNFMDSSTFYGTCNYCCEVIIAATWNTELVEEFGSAVGEEGLWGDVKQGTPYSGWYAPGVNIHRSPFGGRNFEYFSEDGFLAGKIAAAQVTGCAKKGVYCYMKHFALNEQETHRSINGDCSWVTEQAMREIYLKPFEIAVKEGNLRGVMTSFNRIGTRWTGGDYRLVTEILRNEWGFRGIVICDFNTCSHMDSRQMAYAGGDLNLATLPVSWCDTSDAADVTILRQAVKNILYTVVNSNAMNGEVVRYKMPYWQITLIIVDCVAAVGIAVWGALVFKKRKHKEHD